MREEGKRRGGGMEKILLELIKREKNERRITLAKFSILDFSNLYFLFLIIMHMHNILYIHYLELAKLHKLHIVQLNLAVPKKIPNKLLVDLQDSYSQ